MFIIYAVVLGILLGYITGGRLKNIMSNPFNWKLIVIIGFIIQIFLFSVMPAFKLSNNIITVVLHIISYICLLAFVIKNISIAGIAIIGLGIFLNALAIVLNGGYMPTIPENFKQTSLAKYAESITNGTAFHNSSMMTDQTVLPWLCDIFYLPSWLPFSNVFSIGDVIIAVGICVYLIINMKKACPKD